MKYLLFLFLVLFIGCESDSKDLNLQTTSTNDIHNDFTIQYNSYPIRWDRLKEFINRPVDDKKYIEGNKSITLQIQFYTIPYSDKTYDGIGASVYVNPNGTSGSTYYYNNQEVSKEFVAERKKQVAQIKAEEDKIRAQNLKEILKIFTQRNNLSQHPETETYIQNFTNGESQNLTISIKLRKDEIENFIALNDGLLLSASIRIQFNGYLGLDFVYDKNSTKNKIYFLLDSYARGTKIIDNSITINNIIFPDNDKGDEGTLILLSYEELDRLIGKLIEEYEEPTIIVNKLKSININFEKNSIVILPYYSSCLSPIQTVINIGNENNASIKMRVKPCVATCYCSMATRSIVRLFVVSKEIKTINGKHNF